MLYESTTTRHFTHHLYDVSTTIFWRALEGGAGGNQDCKTLMVSPCNIFYFNI